MQRALALFTVVMTIITTILTASTSSAIALENTQRSQTNNQEMRLKQVRTTQTASRGAQKGTICSTAGDILAKQEQRFVAVQKQHNQHLTNLQNRLSLLIQRLESAGVDASALQADQSKLSTLTEAFNDEVASYLRELQAAVTLLPNCGTDSGEFTQQMKTARTQHKQVVAAAAAIRTFVAGTLKTDLKTAKTQLLTMRSAAKSGLPKPSLSPRPLRQATEGAQQ